MPSDGPRSPGTGAHIAGVLVDWVNPGNILASDDSRATCTLNAGQQSDGLVASNFGFSIDSGATIVGILVEVEKSVDSAAAGFIDFSAQLTKNAGVGVVGTNHADPNDWPTTDAYVSYGSASDLWGTSWTPSEINNSGFGFWIDLNNGSGGTHTGRVDHVRITVTFSVEETQYVQAQGIKPRLANTKVQRSLGSGLTSSGDQSLVSPEPAPIRSFPTIPKLQGTKVQRWLAFPQPRPDDVITTTFITPDLLVHGHQVFAPDLDVVLFPTFLTHTHQVFSPQINVRIFPSQLTHTHQVFTPTVVIGPATLLPALLTHTHQVFSPQVNPQLRPAQLVHTHQVFSPQVNPTIKPALLTHTHQAFAPTIVYTVKPAQLVHTHQVFTPKVNPKIMVEQLVHTHQVFAIARVYDPNAPVSTDTPERSKRGAGT